MGCAPAKHKDKAILSTRTGIDAMGKSRKKSRNEGVSHDLVDNKGSVWGTHDVYENK
jgi:hypothetical protein